MEKKHKVIDLFCGCGGLSKGFQLAGFEIVGGIKMQLKHIIKILKMLRGYVVIYHKCLKKT